MKSAFFIIKKSRQIPQETLWPHHFDEKIVRQIFFSQISWRKKLQVWKTKKTKKTDKRTTPLQITPALIRKFSSMTSIVLARKLLVRNIFVFIKSAKESNYEWKQRKVEDKIEEPLKRFVSVFCNRTSLRTTTWFDTEKILSNYTRNSDRLNEKLSIKFFQNQVS